MATQHHPGSSQPLPESGIGVRQRQELEVISRHFARLIVNYEELEGDLFVARVNKCDDIDTHGRLKLRHAVEAVLAVDDNADRLAFRGHLKSRAGV